MDTSDLVLAVAVASSMSEVVHRTIAGLCRARTTGSDWLLAVLSVHCAQSSLQCVCTASCLHSEGSLDARDIPDSDSQP